MPDSDFDLIIYGAGPAGLSAALYAARAGLKVKVKESTAIGGTLLEIPEIHNYPGFVGSGADLAKIMSTQATSAGAVIEYIDEEPKSSSEGHKTWPSGPERSEEELFEPLLLIATGSTPKTLPFSLSAPTSYCVLCDAPLTKGKRVAVVGGGNSAISGAILLADLAASVDIFCDVELSAESTLQTRLKSLKNVTIHEKSPAAADTLNSFDHVFVLIGRTFATAGLPTSVISLSGHILTDAHHQTSLPGIFAAGSVREGVQNQVITSVADGAAAAIDIANFLKKA